jgi:hypothetical protein
VKSMNFILHLVSEWPLGPPRYPVKKVTCAYCKRDVWLEVSPDYSLMTEHVKFVSTDCANPKAGGPSSGVD